MKKCRILKTDRGYTVRGTFFKDRDSADLYAYYLAIALNNGGKLIYVESMEEAIQKHNELEGKTNDEWLKCCWRRNSGCYLYTQNVYALNGK